MYIYKEKRSLAFILLSLFGFVLLWAVVIDAWGYSSNLAFGYGKQVYALIMPRFTFAIMMSDMIAFITSATASDQTRPFRPQTAFIISMTGFIFDS